MAIRIKLTACRTRLPRRTDGFFTLNQEQVRAAPSSLPAAPGIAVSMSIILLLQGSCVHYWASPLEGRLCRDGKWR
jgi:hypothetical protein